MAEHEAEGSLEGRLGRVTVAITRGSPGEIVVTLHGSGERFVAWCDSAVPKHAPVVIVSHRSEGVVDVAPFHGAARTGSAQS